MPNMTVYCVEDVNLNVADFEMKDTPKEIHFDIKGELIIRDSVSP